MSRIASLLGTDLAGLEVDRAVARLRPLIGFSSPRLALRILQNTNDWWVISIKILDGKPPAEPPLAKMLRRCGANTARPVDCELLPDGWQFPRRSHPDGALTFTETVPDAFWLHTFIYILTHELDQY